MGQLLQHCNLLSSLVIHYGRLLAELGIVRSVAVLRVKARPARPQLTNFVSASIAFLEFHNTVDLTAILAVVDAEGIWLILPLSLGLAISANDLLLQVDLVFITLVVCPGGHPDRLVSL